MGIRGKKWIDVDQITEELLSRNERNLNIWLEIQEAENELRDQVATNGYISVMA